MHPTHKEAEKAIKPAGEAAICMKCQRLHFLSLCKSGWVASPLLLSLHRRCTHYNRVGRRVRAEQKSQKEKIATIKDIFTQRQQNPRQPNFQPLSNNQWPPTCSGFPWSAAGGRAAWNWLTSSTITGFFIGLRVTRLNLANRFSSVTDNNQSINQSTNQSIDQSINQ